MVIETAVGVVVSVGALIVLRAFSKDDFAMYDLPLGQRFVTTDAEAVSYTHLTLPTILLV